MQNLNQLLQADAERMFLDWGEPARLLEVSARFKVESGRMEEYTGITNISVIRTEDHPHLVGHISATLSLTRKLLLAQRLEIPETVALTSARLVLDETTYEISQVRESNQAGVLVLECVQSGLPGDGV